MSVKQAGVFFLVYSSLILSDIVHVSSPATTTVAVLPDLYEVRDGHFVESKTADERGRSWTQRQRLDRLEILSNDLVFNAPQVSCIEEKMTSKNSYGGKTEQLEVKLKFEDVHEQAGFYHVRRTSMAVRPHCEFDVVVPFVNSSKKARISGEFCGPEHITGGAAVGDYNGDGMEDIFFSVFQGRSVLYKNNGDGTFTDVTTETGIGPKSKANGAVWVDVDQDGDLDLYVTTVGDTRYFLYINYGGHFIEEAMNRTCSLQTSDKRKLSGMTPNVGDFDSDGFLDIYVAEWIPENLGKPSVSRLLRNKGFIEPGYFEDVTLAAGVNMDDAFNGPPLNSGTFVFGSFTPNFLARVMRKAGLKKKKDESSKAKRNSVQLLRVDNSPFLEEFESNNAASSNDDSQGILVATPFHQFEEDGSLGSRESSASGESKGATKTLLNSSLISAQSEVVLRRPREMSPYVSTPALSRLDEPDTVRLRAATHDVTAFRARQVRSEIFNDGDWSPGRLGRPRSMDALDKFPSSSSTLTPVESRESVHDDTEIGRPARYLRLGIRPSPAGSPSTLRKAPLWARSSPNISPVPPRKEYPMAPGPPSPPSPVSSRRSVSPRSSPSLSRKFQEEPKNSSPHHTPVMARKDVDSADKRSSLPSSSSQSLESMSLRERPVGMTRSNISVQVIAAGNAPERDTTQSQPTSTFVSSPLQKEEMKRQPVELVQNRPYHERQGSGGSESHFHTSNSTPHGLQRQRSLSGGRNGTDLSREHPNSSPSIQHTRERSLSVERKDGKLIIQPILTREVPGRESDGAVPERNEAIRLSQRQGSQFMSPAIPARQSVLVTAHHVTAGSSGNKDTKPSAAATSTTGTAVYIDATGVDLSTTPVISHGNRGEVSSSSVYAVIRDKRGDERVISGSYSTQSSRDILTTPRQNPSWTRDSVLPESISGSRGDVSDSSPASRVYNTPSSSSRLRSSFTSTTVEVKPSSIEQRDENRNDTRVRVSATITQVPIARNDDETLGVSNVRARVLEIDHQSPESSRPPPYPTPQPDDDYDRASVPSQSSRDYSPALRRLRKTRKGGKDKEIFFDSPTLSEASSPASARRSGGEERSRTRPMGSNQGDGKKSSIWYEYGCV